MEVYKKNATKSLKFIDEKINETNFSRDENLINFENNFFPLFYKMVDENEHLNENSKNQFKKFKF
jgi:hypothetical protein